MCTMCMTCMDIYRAIGNPRYEQIGISYDSYTTLDISATRIFNHSVLCTLINYMINIFVNNI